MKKNVLKLIFILAVVVLIYFLKTYFADYNLAKSISACVMAEKQTSESFDLEKSKKYCEENVGKKKESN